MSALRDNQIRDEMSPVVRSCDPPQVLTFPERDYGGSPNYQTRSDKTQTVDKHGPDCVIVFDASKYQSESSSIGITYDKAPSVRTDKPSAILETSTEKSRTILAKGNASLDASLCSCVCEKAHDRPCGTINDRGMALVQFNRARRLSPSETEALFGVERDYTRWRDDGTEIKDSPRYEMLGDGVVSNVSEWLGRGLIEG